MLRFLTSFRLFRPRTEITLKLLGDRRCAEDLNRDAFQFTRDLLQRQPHITLTIEYQLPDEPSPTKEGWPTPPKPTFVT